MQSSLRTILPFLEILEARIAPAILIVLSGHSASYTDVDGDHIVIKVSSGVLTASDFVTLSDGAGHDQLQTIDLSGGGFDGANLSISVVRVLGGNGLANIGYINSTGHDLGSVNIQGDLGRIDAGSDSGMVPAVESLNAYSMGRLGTDTQTAGGSLQSALWVRWARSELATMS